MSDKPAKKSTELSIWTFAILCFISFQLFFMDPKASLTAFMVFGPLVIVVIYLFVGIPLIWQMSKLTVKLLKIIAYKPIKELFRKLFFKGYEPPMLGYRFHIMTSLAEIRPIIVAMILYAIPLGILTYLFIPQYPKVFNMGKAVYEVFTKDREEKIIFNDA